MNEMSRTRKLTLSAVFAALICLTTLLRFPIGIGSAYIHLGDSVIFACAAVLGPISTLPAALGSALADLLAGAPIYLPATAVIKALMAWLCAVLFVRASGIWARLGIMLGCGLLMTVGYLLYELALFGVAYALPSLPFNLVQALGGALGGLALGAVALRILPATKGKP